MPRRLLQAGRLATITLGAVCCTLVALWLAYCVLVALVRLWLLLAHGGMAWVRGAERVMSAMAAWYIRKVG